jgi:hypothetical protein
MSGYGKNLRTTLQIVQPYWQSTSFVTPERGFDYTLEQAGSESKDDFEIPGLFCV